MFHHTSTHRNQAMYVLRYRMPFAMLSHILWLPKKDVADLCIAIGIKIFPLCASYVAQDVGLYKTWNSGLDYGLTALLNYLGSDQCLYQ